MQKILAVDNVPYLAFLLLACLAGTAVVLSRGYISRRRELLEKLALSLPGRLNDDWAAIAAMFLNIDTSVFSGIYRGVNFDILMDNNRGPGGLLRAPQRMTLVFHSDSGFTLKAVKRTAFNAAADALLDANGQRELRPGVWAERLLMRSDDIHGAAEYFSAPEAQEAVRGLFALGYDEFSIERRRLALSVLLGEIGRDEKELSWEKFSRVMAAMSVLAERPRRSSLS